MYTVPDHLPTDPILQDLVPEFLQQWAHDLTVTFAEMRRSGSTEDLKRFGHTMKGSFLQFGFRDLSVVGKEIMIDAEAGNWDAAEQKVQDMLGVVRTLQQRIANGELS